MMVGELETCNALIGSQRLINTHGNASLMVIISGRTLIGVDLSEGTGSGQVGGP